MEGKNERETVAAQFDRHAEEEGRILAEYRALSEKLGDGPAGFLVNLILTEEELHHLLLSTMAKWLREPPGSDEHMGGHGGDRDELLRQTQRLQQHERETIDACRRLRSQLPSRHEDLLASLVEILIVDSEKHAKLLSVVDKLVRG